MQELFKYIVIFFPERPHDDSTIETTIYSPHQFVGETNKTFSPHL
jgi:hypothetical protein